MKRDKLYKLVLLVSISPSGKIEIENDPIIYPIKRRKKLSRVLWEILWHLRDGREHFRSEFSEYDPNRLTFLKQKGWIKVDGCKISITPTGLKKLEESFRHGDMLSEKIDNQGYISIGDLQLCYPDVDLDDFFELYGPAKHIRVIRSTKYNDAGIKPILKVHYQDFISVFKVSPHYHPEEDEF